MMAEGHGKGGMRTFQQHLEELVAAGTISPETAKAVSGNVERKAKGRKGSAE